MIIYKRTFWYGFSYFTKLNGSLLPRCAPVAVWSAFVSGFFASGLVNWPVRSLFSHPYAMQLLGLVFGYLSVARLNISYNRRLLATASQAHFALLPTHASSPQSCPTLQTLWPRFTGPPTIGKGSLLRGLVLRSDRVYIVPGSTRS